MMITKKAIPRRTMLRGIGVSLALPLLDGMVPALSALARTPAKPFNRLGVIYLPNGMMMPDWTPASIGSGFEFSRILQPLLKYRDQLQVLSGLNSKPPPLKPGQEVGPHARASTRFLTNVPPKFTSGSDLEAGESMDQIFAKRVGQQTQLTSLELNMESTESAGVCSVGYSCAYTNTVSWRNATTPLPTENDPRVVFERMFGDSGTTDPAARRTRMQEQRSILDSVIERATDLARGLGTTDRTKLGGYLDAIRDIERRIQNAEQQSAQEPEIADRPSGIPATFEAHAKLLYDLQVLAYQCDMTRAITFMMGREQTGMAYPELGVSEAHHPTSHHQGDPEKIEKVTKINVFHTSLFAYYLDKLKSTPDGDGSLLDHMTILYGAGMSDSNSHNPFDLPLLLVGGGAGMFRGGGRHVQFPKETPLANLHVTLLDKLGVPIEHIGDSTGRVEELSGL